MTGGETSGSGARATVLPPPSGGKRKTQSLVGGDDDDDATIHDNDGDGNAGGGIARHDSTVYAKAESAGLWRDDGNCTRRWLTTMCLLDRMGGMTTMLSLLLRRIEDHNDGLSSS